MFSLLSLHKFSFGIFIHLIFAISRNTIDVFFFFFFTWIFVAPELLIYPLA